MKQGQRLVRAAITFCVRNAKNARTWERKQNVRRAQSARLKNVQIYMSFRAAKRIAPIIATTVHLSNSSKSRERKITIIINNAAVCVQCKIDGTSPRLQEKENEKNFINEFGFGSECFVE